MRFLKRGADPEEDGVQVAPPGQQAREGRPFTALSSGRSAAGLGWPRGGRPCLPVFMRLLGAGSGHPLPEEVTAASGEPPSI